MALYLDSRTTAYLDSRNVNANDTSNVAAALRNAQAQLSAALLQGSPIEPDTVHFIMDCYNDSTVDVAGLREFLYNESPSRVDYYLQVLKQPLSDALTPLIASGQFAPDVATRDANLYLGIANADHAGATPSAEALRVLAQAGNVNTGSGGINARGAVSSFIQSYIERSRIKGQALDDEVMDIFISMDPAAAKAYIGSVVSLHRLDYKPLGDIYRQLNPNGPTHFPDSPGYTTAQLALGGDFLAAANAGEEPLGGWASLVVERLKNVAGVPLKSGDATLLKELQAVAPQAAAWIAYDLLKAQMADPANPDLDPALLEAVANYRQTLMTALAGEKLARSFCTGNRLHEEAVANDPRKTDNITSSTRPILDVDLYSMGVTPKVGDTIQMYIDGVLAHQYAMQSINVSTGRTLVLPPPPGVADGQHVLTSRIQDGVTGALSAASAPLAITVDTHAPNVTNMDMAGLNGPSNAQSYYYEAYEPGVFGFPPVYLGRWAVLKFDEDIDASAWASVQVMTNDPGNTSNSGWTWTTINCTIDAQAREIHFPLPDNALTGTVPGSPTYGRIGVMVSVQDLAGNRGYLGAPAAALWIAGNPDTEHRPLYAASANTPAPPPPTPAMMDHNAYEALRSVEPVAAKTWLDRYTGANRVGTPPPGAAPAPAAAPATLPRLSAADYQDLAIEALIQHVKFARSDTLATEINYNTEKMHRQNILLAKFQQLAIAVSAIDKQIRTDTALTTLIKDVKDPAVDDAAQGGTINHTLESIALLIDFKLFSSDPVNGHYNPASVRYGDLAVAQKKIEAELTRLNSAQEQTSGDMNINNSQRNESLSQLTDFLRDMNDSHGVLNRNAV